ncbi:ABC-three component system protein [Mesorhizobium sp. M0870]|uniref:ABC-three component system protein n=1 Tax=Mesorhizobium sp. M0870 TaxID=2957016 RepID=UPI003335B3B0
MSTEIPTYISSGSRDCPWDKAALDIVFLHGLIGDRFTSWSDSEDSFWLSWLAQEFPNCNVYTAGYDTELFHALLTGPGASIQDLAISLADSLVSRKAPAPALMFVTHSLGGLIVKQLIRKCSDSANSTFNDLAQSVRGIAFLGTPHQGARLAQSLDTIVRNFKSKVVKQLAYSDDALIDLHEFFRTWATKHSVIIKPYYETEHTWGLHVVDRVTANPNVYGADPIAVQADHIRICKPTNRDAPLYVSISKLIATLAPIRASNGSPPSGGGLVAPGLDALEPSTESTALVPMSTFGTYVVDRAGLAESLSASAERVLDPRCAIGLDGVELTRVKRDESNGLADEVPVPHGLATDILTDYQYYTTTAETDRRDLAQKLLDVGRTYQVNDANRKKERFNMMLRRNIAQPSAVTRYTKLMADVETRFNRHIARLIHQGADSAMIDEAVQRDIVGPCSVVHSTLGHEISASLVDSALYYLAGNCHIRWDNDAA